MSRGRRPRVGAGGPPVRAAATRRSGARYSYRASSALVIGGSPAVEPAIALGGLDGGREPFLLQARRLDVAMAVEQHGRRAPAGAASARPRTDARPEW